MENKYNFSSLFSRWITMLAVVALTSVTATAQTTPHVLFKQDFSSSGTVSSYVNLNSPSTGQFNGITSSSGSAVSITGNALRFARNTGGVSSFTRNTDMAPVPKTLSYKFTMNVTNSSITSNAAVFQVGSGMNTNNAAAASGNTYGRFAVNFTGSNGFAIRNMASGAVSSAFTGVQEITWTLNNSGDTISYIAPNGAVETLPNDRMDIFVGTTKVHDNMTCLAATLEMTDLKFVLQTGIGSVTIDNIDVTYAIPHVECPPSITMVDTDLDFCTADYTPVPPTIYFGRSANSGTQLLSIDYGQSFWPLTASFNGQDFYPEGSADFYWSYEDSLFNTYDCISSIIVQDNQAPVFTNTSTAASYSRLADSGVCTYTITATDTLFDYSAATDNCVDVVLLAPSVDLSGAYTATGLPNLTGVVLPVGTTTATWTVSDGNNDRTRTFDIVVADNQKPIFAGVPANIVQQRSCAGAVTWTAPTATDNCGMASLTSTHTPGVTVFPVGTTTVTYTATDVNGNAETASFTVTINQLTASAVGTDVTCNGAGNGSIDLTVTNIASSATYLWSNGATTEDIASLVPGTYTVTVTDGGCSTTATATIAEPAVLTASTTQTNVTCNGLSNGSIDLSIAGGNTGFTYLWSNGATTQDISGLVAGTYNVTVTDNKGCTATATATITQPDVLVATATSAGNIFCGATTTDITVAASGGTTPYTGVGVFAVSAGTYSYNVTDANGCAATSNSVAVQYLPVHNTTANTRHATIQSAINAATAGDNIDICAGTYNETLTVDKRLTLDGAGATTIINTTVAGTKAMMVTATGANATDRLVIKDMAFTGPSNTGGSDAISF
ncbi:MAG: HYR domain-containing protein, partial [Bacteroidia bacterium]